MSDATKILNACASNPAAAEELLPLVYDELRRMAAARMARESPGQTLQATALVHEAWIRLLGSEADAQCWGNRNYFFAAAAEAMRRVLIDRARRKKRVRHGGEWKRMHLDNLDVAETLEPEIFLEVDEAIEKLVNENSQAGELVKLRFFIGLEMTEIAAAMKISERAAYRLWAFARAWLYKELGQDPSRTGGE